MKRVELCWIAGTSGHSERIIGTPETIASLVIRAMGAFAASIQWFHRYVETSRFAEK